ncbi:MAG: PilW family protein [Geobacteraceae bacterium]|nr:PilW family protein [Geobacteraceae bacterium]
MKSQPLKSVRGYSLIEVVVVLAILGVVSAGLYTTFDSGQREYSVRQATIRMQQQARLAMMNLEKDLKKIGYGFGSMPNLSVKVYNGESDTIDTWTMVDCTDNTVITAINNAPNTDTIEFRYYEGALDLDTDVTLRGSHPEPSSDVLVSDNSGFNDGDFFIIYDPGVPTNHACMLQVTGTSQAGGGDAVIANSGDSDYNPPNKKTGFYPEGGYPSGSIVLNLGSNNFTWCRYYVDANRNLVKQIQRSPTSAITSRVVAVGVEDLQIKYQFADGKWLDAPISGDASYDVENIRTVRVSIIVRTEKADRKYASSTNFQLTGANGNGVAYSSGGYRRLILSSNVSLRNMTLRKDKP